MTHDKSSGYYDSEFLPLAWNEISSDFLFSTKNTNFFHFFLNDFWLILKKVFSFFKNNSRRIHSNSNELFSFGFYEWLSRKTQPKCFEFNLCRYFYEPSLNICSTRHKTWASSTEKIKRWMLHMRNTRTEINAKYHPLQCRSRKKRAEKQLTLSYCAICCTFRSGSLTFFHRNGYDHWKRPLCALHHSRSLISAHMCTTRRMNGLRTCKERLWTKAFFSSFLLNQTKNQINSTLVSKFIKIWCVFFASKLLSLLRSRWIWKEDTQTTQANTLLAIKGILKRKMVKCKRRRKS